MTRGPALAVVAGQLAAFTQGLTFVIEEGGIMQDTGIRPGMTVRSADGDKLGEQVVVERIPADASTTKRRR